MCMCYLVHWQNYDHINWFYEQYIEMQTVYLSVHVSVNFALVVFVINKDHSNLMAHNIIGLRDTEFCDKRLWPLPSSDNEKWHVRQHIVGHMYNLILQNPWSMIHRNIDIKIPVVKRMLLLSKILDLINRGSNRFDLNIIGQGLLY